jgi:hypothetical protein
MKKTRFIVAGIVGGSIILGAGGVAGAAPKASFGIVNSHSATCQQLYNRWHQLDSKPVSELSADERTEKSETLKLYNDAGCRSAGSIVSIYTKFVK